MGKSNLGKVTSITMGQSPPSETYNTEGIGLPFFQGKTDFGIMYPSVRVHCKQPQKVAQTDDVLISVRAPVGATNIADQRCCIGRGLAAISAMPEITYHKYVFYYLRYCEKEIEGMGVGSTFKAISKKDLEAIQIPLPPLPIQKKVADALDRASALIEKRKAQIEKLDLLIKSKFIDMFGDPVTNPMRWGIKQLGELGELNRGISKHRPRNAPELLGGKYPFVQTGEIAGADLYIATYSSSYSEIGYKQSKMWPKGTLCITIAANIAKTAILDFDACFPDSVVGFIPNESTNQLFIHFWFSFFQETIEEQAPQSAQKNINLQILRELQVIVPPLTLQTDFVNFLEIIERLKLKIRRGLKESELLYKSLMQTCFSDNIF